MEKGHYCVSVTAKDNFYFHGFSGLTYIFLNEIDKLEMKFLTKKGIQKLIYDLIF